MEHRAPRLEDEPALLSQRLQRRRTPTLTRPPRAWCIALRASDHRIASSAALVHPSSFSLHPGDPEEHTITLTTPLLKSLTASIHLTAPGETLTDAARLLGTSPAGLLNIRLKGTVRTHHIPPMCYRGHPQPLLYIEHPLDPRQGLPPARPALDLDGEFSRDSHSRILRANAHPRPRLQIARRRSIATTNMRTPS